MTIKEIIEGLKFTVDMFLFDTSTGEIYKEPRNDMDKITIDACNGAIELLEQEQKWTPVSEGLPKLDVDVLVTDIHGNRFVHTLKHDSKDVTFYWEDDAGFFVDFNDVIAWMPLPEPYKVESEG